MQARLSMRQEQQTAQETEQQADAGQGPHRGEVTRVFMRERSYADQRQCQQGRGETDGRQPLDL